MPRLTAINPAHAQGKAKTLLDGVQKTLGVTPNFMRTLASSPMALEAYLAFNQALSGGALGAKVREQIALAVAGANRCDYCASAHMVLGRMAGVSDADLSASLQGHASDPKAEAALMFARAVVDKRGWASDNDIARVRAAGYGDGEIAEIVANVALNIFSNYINHVAQTQIDFPVVETAQRAA